MIADFYMEVFELVALQAAPYKPHVYKRYADDTCLVWSHGRDIVDEFVAFLNGIHENIKFTVELEKAGCLPFWGIMTRKNQDGTLSRGVYRKPTHTNLHLHNLSHHHPARKKKDPCYQRW